MVHAESTVCDDGRRNWHSEEAGDQQRHSNEGTPREFAARSGYPYLVHRLLGGVLDAILDVLCGRAHETIVSGDRDCEMHAGRK